VLLTLAAIQTVTGAIGWPRLFLVVVFAGFVTFVVTFVEQNLDILRDARRQQDGLLRPAFKAILLWSPMLLVGAAGLACHLWVEDRLTAMVYDTAPIDQYCDIQIATSDGGQKHHRIPCREYGSRIQVAAIRRLTLAEAMASQIEEAYLHLQTSIFENALTQPDDLFDNSRLLNAQYWRWEKTYQEQIAKFLSLPAVQFSADEEKAFRSDPEMARLDAEWKPYEVILARGVGGKEFEPINRKLGQLSFQQAQRRLQVAASLMRPSPKNPTESASSLAQSLSRALYLSPKFELKTAQEAANRAEYRTQGKPAFEASAVRALAKESSGAMAAIRDVVPKWEASSDDLSREAAYQRFDITRRCTLEKLSTRIFKDPHEQTPEAIDIPRFTCWLTDQVSFEPVRLSLKESVNESIQFWKAQHAASIELEVRDSLVQTLKDKSAAIDAAARIGERVPHTIDLGRKSCYWIPPTTWLNCLVNFIKEKAENAYSGAREDLGQKYLTRIQLGANKSAETGEEIIIDSRAEAADMLSASADLLQVALDRTIDWLKFFDWVVLGLVIWALLNSFLYVFAVVVFAHAAASTIRLAGPVRTAQGHFRIASPNAALELDKNFTPRLVTRAHLSNQVLRTAIAPWPFSAVLGRLLHRKYFAYNLGGAVSKDSPISLAYADEKYAVDWHLREGEEVVFKYGNFFGASENIQLKTTISLSLSTLLLERIIFHSAYCAKGDGHLFLTADALEVDQLVRDEIDATLPYRLLAFNRQTEFQVQTELSLRSILVDGYLLRRVPKSSRRGLIIAVAPAKQVSLFQGTLRFVGRIFRIC
jgi:hypothetical protein